MTNAVLDSPKVDLPFKLVPGDYFRVVVNTREDINHLIPNRPVKIRMHDTPFAYVMARVNNKGNLVLAAARWRLFYNKQHQRGFAAMTKISTLGVLKFSSTGRLDYINHSGRKWVTSDPRRIVSDFTYCLSSHASQDEALTKRRYDNSIVNHLSQFVFNWLFDHHNIEMSKWNDVSLLHYPMAKYSENLKQRFESHVSGEADYYPLTMPWTAPDPKAAYAYVFKTRTKRPDSLKFRLMVSVLDSDPNEIPLIFDSNKFDEVLTTCQSLFGDDVNKIKKFFPILFGYNQSCHNIMDASWDIVNIVGLKRFENFLSKPYNHQSFYFLTDSIRLLQSLRVIHGVDMDQEFRNRFSNPQRLHDFLSDASNRHYQMMREQRRQNELASMSEIMDQELPEFPVVETDDIVIEGPTTVRDLYDWSSEMSNCISSYWRSVQMNAAQVFAVKHNGRMIANGEIRNKRLVQFLGPGNRSIDANHRETVIAMLQQNNLINDSGVSDNPWF